jgi:hypothetical protein
MREAFLATRTHPQVAGEQPDEGGLGWQVPLAVVALARGAAAGFAAVRSDRMASSDGISPSLQPLTIPRSNALLFGRCQIKPLVPVLLPAVPDK